MSDNVILRSFPESETEALALLYLQNQDLSGLTPEQIYSKYKDAYNRIHGCKRKLPTARIINSPI